MMQRLLTLSLIVLAFCLSALGAEGLPSWATEFDRYVGERMEKVPGAAVGVIQDGRVILAKGYGVRNKETGAAVTTGTLFGVGSVTKSFTAAVVASVIDEGKLAWDTPVRQYLPWFRMVDPVATELITVRDMLTHRSGLPRHDFIRFSTYLTREELVRRVAYLPPNKTFRDVYQYNNLMFVAAGFVAGAQAGSTWEDLVRERIFVPVGMAGSNTSTLDSQKAADFALPYQGGERQEFYVYQKFGVGPNGAVNSNVSDMLRYLEMWLNGGETRSGARVFSKEQAAELRKPVTVADARAMYAPGWRIDMYRGERRVSHGGAITGFRAAVTLFPERRIGIVAMINDESALAGRLVDRLSDHVLGLEPERPVPLPAAVTNGAGQASRASSPRSGNGDRATTRRLRDYTDVYEHPAHGRVRIVVEGDGLAVQFDAMRLRLRAEGEGEAFRSSQGAVRFVRNEKGQVTEVHLPLESAVKPFVFVRAK